MTIFYSLFEDKRITISLLICWLMIMLIGSQGIIQTMNVCVGNTVRFRS